MADSDRKKEPTEPVDALDVLRRASKRRQKEERTTLEMSEPSGGAPPDELGELLVTQGLITRHQLFNALNESYRAGTTLEQAIASMGLVDAETLASVILTYNKK